MHADPDSKKTEEYWDKWGYQPSYSYKPVVSYSQAAPVKGASAAKAAQAGSQWGSDFDAWGRDQDLSIDEEYGKTNAKSYTAESYDEWDNTNNDVNGAQAWGKDRDGAAASSWGSAASKSKTTYPKAAAGWGEPKAYPNASASQAAAQGGYDNDQWAKQAYAQDTDSRWGKSYDSVEAKSYDNEFYNRDIWADDDQWAEDYDRYDRRDDNSYGQAASTNNGGYGGWGYGKKGGVDAASAAGAAGHWGKSVSDFDAWGRDQDYKESVSYDFTNAKAYAAESYDEWDNQDNDKYGAQAWGKDRDVYGASSYGKDASASKNGKNDYGYGRNGWNGASWEGAQQQSGYDNDQWAKQAYGQDYDSRWGKSYDSVSAKSYKNESYDRELWADDDQWAEDYDRYDRRDADSYGAAASASYGKDGYGYGQNYGGYGRAASKAGAAGYDRQNGSDFDAWGRDQDLSIKESYDQTWAKSYEAESYDEWDNKDNDKYGRQGWGIDRDNYGASSYGQKADENDWQKNAKAGYAGYGYNQGYGYGNGYGNNAYGYGNKAYGNYGYDQQDQASATQAAANGAYDNDAWAKQSFASDYDSRWGKSYDSVAAKSYDDEQYSRKVRADDDQWAEDLDRYAARDADSYGKAASSAYQAPAKKSVSYKPVYNGYSAGYGNGYGNYGGYGKW